MRRESSGRAGGALRVRMPLAFVVGRYFLYLLGLLGLAVAVPMAVMIIAINCGAGYPANFGASGLDQTVAYLERQGDVELERIPSFYAYAQLSSDGSRVLSSTKGSPSLEDVRRAVERRAADPSAPRSTPDALVEVGLYPVICQAVRCHDGTWVVLSYQVVPQWTSRAMRDCLPNPQNLALGCMVAGAVASIIAVALRASHVLTAKMSPLVSVARDVGRGELDIPVAHSNVAQIDDVLSAMDAMRASLKQSLEDQWRAEQDRRCEVTLLAHKIKTPLTVMRANAELLMEEAEAGEVSLSEDALEELAALNRAVDDANRCAGNLIAASRGMSHAGFCPDERGVSNAGQAG